MATLRRGVAHMTPLALQVITLANSTAVGVNSTTKTADVLHYSVETNDVRLRIDAAPTLSTGVLLQSDFDYWDWVYNGTANYKFQRSTGTAKVIIQPYNYTVE